MDNAVIEENGENIEWPINLGDEEDFLVIEDQEGLLRLLQNII